MPNKPLVVDLFHGDRVTSFAAVKDAGIVGVIHKATESTNFHDSAYEARRKAFTDLGLKWGAYCFCHGGGVHEADFFLSVAQPDKNTLVALDWEKASNGTPSASAARTFLERIEEKLGRKAVIYSGNAAKEKITGKDAYLGAHRLWLAQYGSLRWKVQASWKRPWLWQYGETGSVPGIKGKCDVNDVVSPMTADDLLRDWAT